MARLLGVGQVAEWFKAPVLKTTSGCKPDWRFPRISNEKQPRRTRTERNPYRFAMAQMSAHMMAPASLPGHEGLTNMRRNRTMDKRTHSELISALIAEFPEIRRAGFWKALRRLRDAEYMMDMFENVPEWKAGVGFVPDAWSIDYNTKHVHIFEIVVSHDVSDAKFAKMVNLAWALDEDHYTLCLTRCDAFDRTAYDVRGASIMNDIERLRAGQPDTGWLVPNWKRFDTQAVRHFIESIDA